MKRRDDDIIVHKNAPLWGILYTKHTRKKLPKGPAHARHTDRSFAGIVRKAAAPFTFIAGIFTKPRGGGKHAVLAAQPIAAQKPGTKAPFAFKAQPALSRVGSKLHEQKRNVYWPLAVTGAVCACIAVAAVIFIPGAFTVEKKQVTINDSGFEVTAVTEEKTVGELLRDFEIEIGEHDSLEVSAKAMVEDDMEIVIRRAIPIGISTMQGDQEVHMVAGTVGDALKKASVEIDENDEVYPELDTYVQPGLAIQVVDVEVKYDTDTERIGFKEITRKNKSLKKGKEVTVREGKQGVREIKYKLIYKNGKLVSRTEVKSTVTKKPVSEIVEIGTRTAVLMEHTPRTSEIYSKTLYDHKKKLKPAPEIIEKVMYADYITAYTHTGHRTATGTYPRIGTVAVDPKKIPYGTKLYIPGYGYGRAEDTGAFRGKNFIQLDLFMDTTKDCLNWGRKREVKFYILK